MILGLDIASDKADFALTADGQTLKSGILTLKNFRDILIDNSVRAAACEVTGWLCRPYRLIAKETGVKLYYLHTNNRAAYSRTYSQTSKTDKHDARTIARMLYTKLDERLSDILRLKEHLFIDSELVEKSWELRSMLNELDKFVAYKTAAELKALTAQRCELAGIANRWERKTVDAEKDVEEVTKEIDQYVRENFTREMELLISIPGIGKRIACYIIAILHPIERFSSLDQVKKYVGFNPRQKDTGKTIGRQKISRTGNPHLRGLMYVAAMGQSRRDSHFADFYKAQVDRGVNKKKAVANTAIHMLESAATVLRKGELYRVVRRPSKADY